MLACSQNWPTLLTHNCSCHSHIIITFYQPCWNWWHLFFLSNEVDWNYLSCTFNMNRDFVDLQKCVFRFIIIICVSDCTIQTGSKKKKKKSFVSCHWAPCIWLGPLYIKAAGGNRCRVVSGLTEGCWFKPFAWCDSQAPWFKSPHCKYVFSNKPRGAPLDHAWMWSTARWMNLTLKTLCWIPFEMSLVVVSSISNHKFVILWKFPSHLFFFCCV